MDFIRSIPSDVNFDRVKFELNKEYSFKGLWWYPSKANEKKAGTLTFNPRKGLMLDIIEDFDIRKKIKGRTSLTSFLSEEENLMHGLLCNGKIVTLTGCSNIRPHFSGSCVKCDSIFSQTAFFGAHFNNIDEIKFNKVYAKLTYLDKWFDVSGLKAEIDLDTGFTINYKEKDPIILNIGKDLKIELFIKPDKIPLIGDSNKVEVIQECIISMNYKKYTEFKRFLEVLSVIQSFLSLSIRWPVYPLFVSGIQDLEKDKFKSINVLYSFRGLPEKPEYLTRHDFLFAFSDVAGKLEDLMNRWFANAKILESVYQIHFLTLDESYFSLQNQFLNVVQAIESFPRIFENNEEMDKTRHEERIKIILEAVPDKYESWLKSRLKYSNEPSLKSRLKYIIKKYSEVTRNFVEDDESFGEKVAKNRNYLAHLDSSSRDQISESEELFELLQKLKLLLLISLLGLLGFSNKDIEKLIVKEKWYVRFCRESKKRKGSK